MRTLSDKTKQLNRERSKEYYTHLTEEQKTRKREYGRYYMRKKRAAGFKYRREDANEWNRNWQRRWRLKVIIFLGEKCVRCGFSDIRGLQIDHINGGGGRERKSDNLLHKNQVHYYKHIIKTNGEGYQLLCANCNQIKRYENEEHRWKYDKHQNYIGMGDISYA